MTQTPEQSSVGFAAVIRRGALVVGALAVSSCAVRPAAVTATPQGSVRHLGSTATWNRPVAELGASDRYASYADRFWSSATLAGWDDPSRRGRFDLTFGDYSVPIYDIRQATEAKRVFRASWGWPGTIPVGGTIPWNPSWQPAGGTDAMMLLLDPSTGIDIEIWAMQEDNWLSCVTVENMVAGFVGGTDLCVGTVNLITHDDGSVADYRVEPGTTPVRGMGIQKLALLTRADEVASGHIDHALEMSIYNTMFGPECSAGDPGAGTESGFYLPPATKVEHAAGPTPSCGGAGMKDVAEDRLRTVPEGMRFALDMTDSEIDAWLDGTGYGETVRSTARIFAVALREYGWIVAETSCYGVGIETDGLTNPETAAVWNRLGVTDPVESARLLDGLFTRERIYVVNPPATPGG